jgi:hypothetical protein
MPPLRAAIPDRREFALQHAPAELEGEQHIPARAVVGAADQRQLALSGGDARLRDAHRIDAGGFLAHEGARGADHAVHQRDIAGEQIGQLRQKQGRAQIAHQALVEEGAGLLDLRTPARMAVSTAMSRSPPPAATIMSVRSSNSALPAMPASLSARPAA